MKKRKRSRGRAKQRAPFYPWESKGLMIRAGITQKSLAADLAISEGAVSRFIRGKGYSSRFWDHFDKVITDRLARPAA